MLSEKRDQRRAKDWQNPRTDTYIGEHTGNTKNTGAIANNCFRHFNVPF